MLLRCANAAMGTGHCLHTNFGTNQVPSKSDPVNLQRSKKVEAQASHASFWQYSSFKAFNSSMSVLF